MLTGFYSGVSGILYNEQKLNVISHNTANVDTPGFRRSLLMLKSRQAPEGRASVHSAVAKRNPDTQGVQRTGIFQDHEKTGRLRQTDNPFDIAIPTELKNAFFAVHRPGDASETLYTRNGSLSLGPSDPKNPNSPTVLHLSDHIALDEAQQPISVDASKGPIVVSIDGSIQQAGQTLGKLPVYRFDKSQDPTLQVSSNLQQLVQRGESMAVIPEQFRNEFNPVRLKVGEGGIQQLTVQGMKEQSNVNMFEQMVEMMATTKAAEANKTALRQQMESLNKLFELARS